MPSPGDPVTIVRNGHVIGHITVDFNNSDEDGLIFARMVRASRPLQQDETVLATDGEESACEARVARIDGELVYLQRIVPVFGCATRDHPPRRHGQ